MSKGISMVDKKPAEIEELVAKAAKGTVFLVKLSQVKILQSREANDEALIQEYAEAIVNGVKFPPGSVVFDPESGGLYLVDGIHRALAHEKADQPEFPVTIKKGTEAEALLASSGSNASHGKKRTNKDKEHAVMMVLRHPVLCRYSNNYLAKEAKVSPQLVDKVRAMLENDPDSPVRSSGRRLAKRNGKTYPMSVAKKAEEGEEGDTSKETPEAIVANVVNRIVASIDKARGKLPAELQGVFSREVLRGLDELFGTETLKS